MNVSDSASQFPYVCPVSLPRQYVIAASLPFPASSAPQIDGGRHIRGNVHPKRDTGLCKHLVPSTPRAPHRSHPPSPNLLLLLTNRNILRDESVFKDPHLFKPERYLEPVDGEMAKRRDPKNYAFGFGRRVCPHYLFPPIPR